MDQRRIEQCVEQLCAKGCRAVWDDIAALDEGVPLPEVKGLTPMEVSTVIDELKAVMAVYEGSCSADVPRQLPAAVRAARILRDPR